MLTSTRARVTRCIMVPVAAAWENAGERADMGCPRERLYLACQPGSLLDSVPPVCTQMRLPAPSGAGLLELEHHELLVHDGSHAGNPRTAAIHRPDPAALPAVGACVLLAGVLIYMIMAWSCGRCAAYKRRKGESDSMRVQALEQEPQLTQA